jgi:hypothetical protein
MAAVDPTRPASIETSFSESGRLLVRFARGISPKSAIPMALPPTWNRPTMYIGAGSLVIVNDRDGGMAKASEF